MMGPEVYEVRNTLRRGHVCWEDQVSRALG